MPKRWLFAIIVNIPSKKIIANDSQKTHRFIGIKIGKRNDCFQTGFPKNYFSPPSAILKLLKYPFKQTLTHMA